MGFAQVGIRPGRQSFLLIVTSSARNQRRAWEVLDALSAVGVIHPDAEVVMSRQDDLLLVLPAAVRNVERLIQIILEATTRASIKLERREMPPSDFEAYDVLVQMARTQSRADPLNN